jgi:acetyl/propionyl-CoA carboxylase alpha subunit
MPTIQSTSRRKPKLPAALRVIGGGNFGLIEVQILGDLNGTVTHLGERECRVQPRFQKIIEVAPAPGLDDELRCRIIEAAVRFAKSVVYTNLGTFEFLVDVTGQAGAQPFVFIETNARL